jgi:predicted ester cyclase
MSETNKDLIRRYQDAWNTADIDALEGILAPDWRSNSWPEGLPANVDGLRQFLQFGGSVFSKVEYETEQLIAEGDWVAQRYTAYWTHTEGDFAGVPPSGRRIEGGGISMYRVVDGRIVEHWAFADELGTLHRFGAAVPPEWLALCHRSS